MRRPCAYPAIDSKSVSSVTIEPGEIAKADASTTQAPAKQIEDVAPWLGSPSSPSPLSLFQDRFGQASCVKAVTGCGFNSRFWVFAGGLTNVNVVMTVTDTLTGAVKTYTNPQSTAFQPIQDTSAFTCP